MPDNTQPITQNAPEPEATSQFEDATIPEQSTTPSNLDQTTALLSGFHPGDQSQQGQAQQSDADDAANAAATRPRTGLFARILYGALHGMNSGLKGAGEGLVMGGIPGAVEGAVSPKTVQTAWDQRQQVAQSKVDFFKARAAYETTEALNAHNVMEQQGEQWKQNQSDRAVEKMMEFQHLGLSPAEFPQDNSEDALRVVQDFVGNGKIPYVLHAPASDGVHGNLIVYDLSPLIKAPAMSEPVKQGLALLNDPTTDKDFAAMNPQQRLAVIQKGLTSLDVTPAGSPSEILNQINQLASLKRVYATAHANDPGLRSDLAKYDASIESLKAARKNLMAGASEESKQAAQNAGQKSYQEAYGKTAGEQAALNAGAIPGQPNARQALIDDIGQGRVQLTPGMLRSKDGQALLQQIVGKYNDYDPTRADAYKKTREDFTSGKTAVGINSYNTAIAHLGTMFDHVSNASSVSINNPMSDVHRQLDLDKQLVSTELAKAVSNGNLTEGEKNDLLKSISGYTVDSYKTRIKEAVQLLQGKLESYQQQWSNGMPKGAVSPVPIVSQQSDATLAKISGNGQNSRSAQTQGRAVRDVSGNVIGYTVDGKTMTPVAGGR